MLLPCLDALKHVVTPRVLQMLAAVGAHGREVAASHRMQVLPFMSVGADGPPDVGVAALLDVGATTCECGQGRRQSWAGE
jgi:hypothetical protein